MAPTNFPIEKNYNTIVKNSNTFLLLLNSL